MSKFNFLLGLFWVRQTLLATRETVEAALAANELTRASMQTSERAWVSSKIVVLGPISFRDGDHWDVEIAIRNTNTGKTPALYVSTNVVAASMQEIDGALAYLRDDSLKHKMNGIALAPNDSYDRHWRFSSSMVFQEFAKDDGIADFIVGCVTYTTIFDEDPRRNIFVYHASRTVPSAGVFLGELRDGMPPDELYLWPWTGSSSD